MVPGAQLAAIRRRWLRWRRRWWTRQFAQHCQRVGTGLEVMGPCRVDGLGTIVAGERCVIRSHAANQVEINAGTGAQIALGDRVFVNQGTRIVASSAIQIGNGCLIGDECVIIDSDYHAVGDAPVKCAPITIEDDVWLATRVIVLRGVTIGQGSVIGAGAVVTRSIPPYSFAAGAPARVIKQLAPQEQHV
jgi:acetyltransferase-like isoleucine patch superfamily enzyme